MPPSVLPAPGLVLAGFVPGDEARLRRALSLPPEAFPDPSDKAIYRLYSAYYRERRGVLPVQFIGKRLEGEPPEVAQRIAQRFTLLRDTEVEDHVFEWALTSTFEDWRDDEARQVLSRGVHTLLGAGSVDGEGNNAKAVRGYQAMRDVLAKGFQRIDRQAQGSVPELDLTEAGGTLLSALGSAETEARFHFPTGISVLDSAMPYGGPAAGQLWFVAGFAGTGKTTFCTSVLAHQALMNQLNVLYLTGETLLDEVTLKLLARHTRQPMFGLPSGIDLMAVRQPHGLDQRHLEVYHAAINDLTSGSMEGRYGRMLVRQMPMRNNVDDVLETLERIEASWPVHMLIVDSIDMVRIGAEMARGAVSYREQLSATIEDFANLAVSYDNGRGLIIVSPYQIKRDAYDQALANKGRYELSALSETAMAERRASVVLSLLALPDSPGSLRAQVLKNRYGPQPEFQLEVDFRSAFMGAGAAVAQSASDLAF